MENGIVKTDNSEIIQKLVLDGDLSKMNQQQKLQYYNQFCQSLGLNPLTQPFQLIIFQGKQKLYATKDCTEQLRKIHGVSITDVTAIELKGVYVVTAKAQDKTGKTDAATGVVNIEGIKGDALANALMKAETKAKRRVTLSICGLGILDESETDTMPVHETKPITQDVEVNEVPTELEKGLLKSLVWTSGLDENKKVEALQTIDKCNDYKTFEKIQHRLDDLQPSIDEIPNPNQGDIKKHIKKFTKVPVE